MCNTIETVTPHRIQRRRNKGWQKPAGAVDVTRASIFGNPWKAGEPHPMTGWKMSREDVVNLYQMWIDERPSIDNDRLATFRVVIGRSMELRGQAVARAAHALLTGKVLMCWCGVDEPCHADPLLDLVNPKEKNGDSHP